MSILPHNIVNDTKWTCLGTGDWFCNPTLRVRVYLRRLGGGFVAQSPLLGMEQFDAPDVPAAKAEALRLVREAILTEAEAWR